MERRSSTRHSMDLACRLFHGDRETRGQLLDIADGGLAVKTATAATQGDSFRVVILRPGARSIEVDALAWHSRSIRLASGRAAFVTGLVLAAPSADFEALVCERAEFADRLKRPLRPVPPRPAARRGLASAARRGPLPPFDPKADPVSGHPTSDTLEPDKSADAAFEEPKDTAELGAVRLYRIRMGQGPRTRSVCIGAESEDEARRAAAEEFGREWTLLEVALK